MFSDILSVRWELSAGGRHQVRYVEKKKWKTYTKTARGGGSLPAKILDVTSQSIVMVTSYGVKIFESTLQ